MVSWQRSGLDTHRGNSTVHFHFLHSWVIPAAVEEEWAVQELKGQRFDAEESLSKTLMPSCSQCMALACQCV